LLPESREAPEVKAHASTGDWVQLGGLRRQVQPTACAIRKRFGRIGKVLGVAAVKECSKVNLRPWPTR
jgi:hypothetical protein